MTEQAKGTEAIRLVAQVDRDGSLFFRRANRVAADPRVKYIFGHAAEEYERAATAVEPLVRGKKRAKAPDVFPFAEYERIECYVCGHEAEADNLPSTCPSCGAAGYAFEREISQEGAWEIVARTTKEVQSLARKASSEVRDAEAKAALAEAAEIRKRLLEDAKGAKGRKDASD